jgi:hypothetical protein
MTSKNKSKHVLYINDTRYDFNTFLINRIISVAVDKIKRYQPKGLSVLIFLPPLARTTRWERRDKVGSPLALTGDDVLKEKEEETMVAISTLSHNTPSLV